MSTIRLANSIFTSVENKLKDFGSADYIDMEHDFYFSCSALGMKSLPWLDTETYKDMYGIIHQWIVEAYHYNLCACIDRDGQGKKISEYVPDMNAQKISIIQCYKYLRCILYNSKMDYNMSDYQKWVEQGERMLQYIATHVVLQSEAYKEAKWFD